MKKTVALILVLIIASLSATCSPLNRMTGASGDLVSPEPKGDKQEITILYYPREKGQTSIDSKFFTSYVKEFEEKFGAKVKFVAPSGANDNDFEEALAAMMYAKEGPELIYYEKVFYLLQQLTEQGALVNVKEKVANIDKMYDSLQKDEMYYVPVGIHYGAIVLNKEKLDEIGVKEIPLDWTKKDYRDIWLKWLDKSPRFFTWHEYFEIAEMHIGNLDYYDRENNRAKINTPEMKEAIRGLRNEIFSGNYKLNKDYTFKNYYNAFRESQSEEAQRNLEIIRSEEYNRDLLKKEYETESSTNLLRASEVYNRMLKGSVVLPKETDRVGEIGSLGFAVNKNGKNLELAYEFINGFLSDETQMIMVDELYDRYNFYPVNQDIENDIKNLKFENEVDSKALEIRDYALEQLKSGKLILDADYDRDDRKYVYNGIRYRTFEAVFADEPYSDEQLTQLLQKIENETNLWLNE